MWKMTNTESRRRGVSHIQYKIRKANWIGRIWRKESLKLLKHVTDGILFFYTNYLSTLSRHKVKLKAH